MDMTKDSYQACLEAMYGLRRFGIKLGLETIRQVMDNLSNPQDRFASVHIAGTNGKGSIASTLSAILECAGYAVGLYTSPHLVHFNERICINNQPVSDEDVVEAYHAVNDSHQGERSLTFFEFSTAMALYTFAKKNVDWAIIETGMGGRLDATNILKPELSIITNISLEHRSYLGNTIAEIAGEKAGIIKEKTPVVTGAKQKTVLDKIKEVADAKSAPLFRLGGEFKVRRNQNKTFTYYGIDNKWTNLKTKLSGEFQIENAAIALAASELVSRNGATLTYDTVREGIRKTRWPGRLEVVMERPMVIFDGAHNLMASRKLADFLIGELSHKQVVMVIGILDDKPYGAMLKNLLPGCSKVILTQARTDRALPPEKLHKVASELIEDVTVIPKVEDALYYAIDTASPDDAICVAGSLYVVGEAKEAFDKRYKA